MVHDTADRLQREFGFHPDVAAAAAEANGSCCYCGEDLLASRVGYSSIARDHLVPSYRGSALNAVLACTSCKNMKADFDPLHESENAEQMLREEKDRLIQRVRTHLQKQIIARKSEWYQVRDILRGGPQARMRPE